MGIVHFILHTEYSVLGTDGWPGDSGGLPLPPGFSLVSPDCIWGRTKTRQAANIPGSDGDDGDDSFSHRSI